MNQRPTLLLLFLFFQPSKLLKRYSHLHPLLHHALVPCAYREQDLVSLILHSRARPCCSCRPMRARDTSTTAFPLRALQATKLLKRCSHLHLFLRPLLHLSLGPHAHREQDLVSLILQSRARLCCSRRPMRARDTSTTAFPLRALEVAFGRVFALRTLKYKPVHGLQLFQVAIQVQRPFPYVHSRLPLREFSHFAP